MNFQEINKVIGEWYNSIPLGRLSILLLGITVFVLVSLWATHEPKNKKKEVAEGEKEENQEVFMYGPFGQ